MEQRTTNPQAAQLEAEGQEDHTSDSARPRLPGIGAVASNFQHLLQTAAELTSGNLGGARQVLADARAARLPQGEMAVLKAEVGAATGFDNTVIRGLLDDAATYHSDHGFLQTHAELAEAFGESLMGADGGLVFTDGGFWWYPPASGQTEGGEDAQATEPRWHLLTGGEAEARLIAGFDGHPLVRQPRDRKEVLRRLATLCEVDSDYFSEASPGVNLANGFLLFDKEAGRMGLVPHDAEHGARALLPVEYDPDAQAPVFTAGINRIMGGDPGKVRCFLQFLACIVFNILPQRDGVRTVLFLFGPPRSGKSTLIQLIQRMVAPYAQVSISPELWSDEKHRARFRGALLNSVSELGSGANRAISGHHFKVIASHEPTTAREVYQQSVSFTPRALHVFACNQLPTIGERDPSIHRRLVVLRVGQAISDAELNTTFLEDCWAEAPGIIRLLAGEAERMWQDGQFALPPDNLSHILRMQFRDRPEEILARLGIKAAPGERATSSDLQAALRKVAEEMDMDTYSWVPARAMRTLSARLTDLYGAVRRSSRGAPFYENIRLKPEYRAEGDAQGAADYGTGPRRLRDSSLDDL